MKGISLCIILCAGIFIAPHYASADDTSDRTTENRLANSVAKLKGSLKAEDQEKSNPVTKSLDGWSTDKPANETNVSATMLKGLGLCIGVFLIGTAIVKRSRLGSGNTTQQRLRVLERAALTSKHALILAQLDGRDFVVAVGPDSLAFHEPTSVQEDESPEDEAVWNGKVVHGNASSS